MALPAPDFASGPPTHSCFLAFSQYSSELPQDVHKTGSIFHLGFNAGRGYCQQRAVTGDGASVVPLKHLVRNIIARTALITKEPQKFAVIALGESCGSQKSDYKFEEPDDCRRRICIATVPADV
jgi:hypothetical protein